MRLARRILLWKDRTQYFHVVSRVVDRRRIFGDEEKSVFFRTMRKMEAFSGVRVLAYSLMGNHFHILLEVPRCPSEISEEEIWKRMRFLYSEEHLDQFRSDLEGWKEMGMVTQIEEFYAGMRKRMYDLSEFVKGLKQRFSIWYNGVNERKGTLWEERFKSVLVEGSNKSLMAVAAYIELNAVRAGLTSEASQYKWCSLYEAMKGSSPAREGIQRVTSGLNGVPVWEESLDIYREYISRRFKGGPGNPTPGRANSRKNPDGSEIYQSAEGSRRVDEAAMSENLDSEWTPSQSSRLRYYTEGLVIGGREFVERFFRSRRGGLCLTRKKISYSVEGSDPDGLHSYRNKI